MTIDDFWEKYNHCPLCIGYNIQGSYCDDCRWQYPSYAKCNGKFDKFQPTEDCMLKMNREVTE